MKTDGNFRSFYVYCYFDPRNHEEFYYGKGTGNRSKAHLLDQGKSEKTARIKAIRAAGTEPVIRIIATGLTEDQAFWTETALLWRLGKGLTNKNRGREAAKFRPPDTFHKNLVGFDFDADVHFFNVGEYKNERCWTDCRRYGFVSAGHGRRDAALQIHSGDLILAYVSKQGYVGIGRATAEAVPASQFRLGKKTLRDLKLKAPGILHHCSDAENCEYVIRVTWLVSKSADEALWKRGLFRARQTRASMANQQKTLRYIEKEWHIKLDKVLEKDDG